MFSNISKTLAASREAIGSAQSFIQERTGLELPGSAGVKAARTPASTANLFDAPLDDEGFRDQALTSSGRPDATNDGHQNGSDLMQFTDDRPSVDLLGSTDSPRDSIDGARPLVPQTATSKSNKPLPAAPAPTPALSSMTPDQVLSMDPAEMSERLTRLRKFESKFQDLARVYKQLQRKLQQLEGVIAAHTPIPKISSTADIETLDAFLLSLKEKQNVSMAEMARLSRQVSEIKEVQELEASTKADMFSSLQSRLVEREEEINRLKHTLARRETPPSSPMLDARSASASSVPPIDAPSTPGHETTVSLKLKVRELTNALTRAKEDRDAVNERCQKLELAQQQRDTQSREAESAASSSVEDVNQSKARIEDAERLHSEAAAALEKERENLQRVKAERDALAAIVQKLEATPPHPPPDSLASDDAQKRNELEAELNGYKARIIDLEANLQHAESSLEQARAQMAEHVKAREELIAERSALGHSNAEHLNGVSTVRAELASLEAKHSAILSESEKAAERVLQLERELSSSNQELSNVRAEREKARSAIAIQSDALSEKERLERELDTQQKDYKASQDKVARLEAELEKLNAKLAQTKENVGGKKALNTEIRKLQTQLTACEAKLAAIESQKAEAFATASELRNQVEAAQSMGEKYRAAQAEIAEAKVQLASALQARDDSVEQIAKLEAAAAKENSDSERMQTLMKAMREKLQAKIAELEQQVKDLQTSQSSAEDVGSLQARLVTARADIEAKARRIAELEELGTPTTPTPEAGPEKGKSRAKLEKQLAAMRAEVAKLKEEARAPPETEGKPAEADALEVERKLETAVTKVAELEALLQAANNKRAQLETEVLALRKRVAQLEEAVAANAQQIDAQQASTAKLAASKEQLESVTREKEAVDAALKRSEDESRAKQEEIRELKEDLAAKENKLKEQQKSAADTLARISELERAADAAKNDKSNTAQRVRKLLDEKKDLTNGIENAEQRVADAIAKLGETEQRLEASKLELEKVSQNLESERAAGAALKQELASVKQACDTAQASVVELTTRLAQSEDTASHAQELLAEQVALKEQLKAANETAQKVIATEARADQLERDMKALTAVRKQLETSRSETESQLKTMEEQLAFAKQAIHERDGHSADLESEIASIRTQLREEEERKAKSIQLLRQSKARILKLEADSKLKDEAAAKLNDELKALQEAREKEAREKEQQLASVTRQIEDMQVRLRRQQEAGGDLERQRHEFSLEKQKIQHHLEELEHAEQSVRAERDAAWEELEASHSELDGLRSLLEAREAQIAGEAGRWADVEDRMANMEVELDTSKRLFQTKSTENDQLRLRVSELEGQVYEATQAAAQSEGDVDQLRRDAREARREVAEKLKDIQRVEKEMATMTQERAETAAQLDELRAQYKKAAAEHAELLRELDEVSERDNERAARIAELVKTIEKLEADRDSVKKDGELAVFSRDKILEDMRVRESQLKNLNKTLKDEVRKLNRTSSFSSGIGNPNTPTSSSMQSPPPISRPPSTGSISRHSHHGSLGSLASDDSFPRRDSVGARPSFPARMSSTVAAVEAPPPPDEYLKAVLLKFLEAKDKRVHLLPVLGMLLRFSPEELKRVQKFA
ncbi:hypothetical protein HDU87_001051 [Geranomyces variabilis]|uniref:GRIP domain-containing protein n=1 Tax=Geranomyces variabilis TaxID=109894 RepID=A0AAD5XPH2_9FUNG|nr:hypothetical protein HDU87_001051 [Geranomyces variabilis]